MAKSRQSGGIHSWARWARGACSGEVSRGLPKTAHRRALLAVASSAFALVAAWTWGAVRANTFAPEPFDTTILGTDAVLVATVDALKLDPSRGVTEVMLRDVDVLTTRIDLGTQLRSLHVASSLRPGGDTDDTVTPSPMNSAIENGHRYFFFLRGGPWHDWPLVQRLPPLEVRDDVVHCRGGLVYGIDPMGVLCGIPADYASAPLSESTFGRQIAEALRRARERRPVAAGLADRAARSLERSPILRAIGGAP